MYCNGSYLSLLVPRNYLPIAYFLHPNRFFIFMFWFWIFSSSFFIIYLPWTNLLISLFIAWTFTFLNWPLPHFSAAYFWYRETLNISPDVNQPEEINWVKISPLNHQYYLLHIFSQFSVWLYLVIFQPILLCVFTSWILVYFAMVKGITESPKVWIEPLLPSWTWAKFTKQEDLQD